MIDAPKISKDEKLRDSYPKLNQAIDNANEALKKSTTAETNSSNAVTTANSVQAQFNQVVKEGDSSVEAAQARVDRLGKSYTTLKEREDADQARTMKRAVMLSDFSSVTAAIDYAVANGVPAIFLDTASASVHNIDFRGLEVIGNNTDISGSMKGVKKVEGAKIKGIDQSERQFGEFDNISGTVTTKLVHKVSETEIHVYSKKPFSNEYLDFKFQRDIYSPTNSAGAPAELLRLTGVYNLTEAYAQLSTPISSAGTWESYTTLLQSASGIPDARNSSLKFYRNTTTGTGSIDFEAYADDSGFISLGFLCTPTSSENITIRYGSALMATVSAKSLTGSNYFIIKKIQTNVRGNITIRIEKSGTEPVYVCSNMYRIYEAPTKAKYDNVAFFDNGNGYIVHNGALDYAMVDENNLYWGSYHGGETLQSLKLLADSTNISSSGNNGRYFACKKMSLFQTTQIGTYFTSRTSMVIGRDGMFDFSFSLAGDANLRTLYTTMTTTKETFNYVMYPKMVNTATDGEYYFGKTNKIVQENTTTNQRITTLFTQFANENSDKGGAFVRVTTGAYNKVYYGPIVSGLRRVTEINGSNTRIFE